MYKVNEVKHVLFMKVKWERYLNKNTVTQCRRCQQFGHATGNCFGSSRCVKFVGTHFSGECPAAPRGTKTEKSKCANCDGDHTASSRDCPTRLKTSNSKSKQAANNNVKQKHTTAPYTPTNSPISRHPHIQYHKHSTQHLHTHPGNRKQTQTTQAHNPQTQARHTKQILMPILKI